MPDIWIVTLINVLSNQQLGICQLILMYKVSHLLLLLYTNIIVWYRHGVGWNFSLYLCCGITGIMIGHI